MEAGDLIHGLFQVAEKTDASDIHLATGEKPYLRIGSLLRDAQVDPLSGPSLRNIIEQITMRNPDSIEPDEGRRKRLMELYKANGSVDYVYETEIPVDGQNKKVRYRINIYNTRGQRNGAGKVCDGQGMWTSKLTETESEIVGNPIHPTGYALPGPVALSKADWQQCLTPGEGVLNMHIPTGSAMDYDECGRSMRQAMEFFPRHFLDRPFVGFDCQSWILDAQFGQLLPPTSKPGPLSAGSLLVPDPVGGRVNDDRVWV